MKVADNMEVREVTIKQLKEQDMNAHMMPPKVFERLVDNVKRRGALESLPYCAQPNGTGSVEIVSGHHRVRAAQAAGLEKINVLVDTSDMTRSQLVAKQLAHNALVGMDDASLIKQLLGFIDNPDDLIQTGLPEDFLENQEEHDAMLLFTPSVDFVWHTCSFLFLPHQLREFNELINQLDGPQELVVACPDEQFEAFIKAASKFAKLKNIKSGGTAVAILIQTALREIEKAEEEEKDDGVRRESVETH